MPFPSKTDRETILAAAVAQVASGGMQQISLRSLAGSLGLAPNALYRYFRDRSELEGAVAAFATRQLQSALAAGIARKPPPAALRGFARAYMHFARTEAGLYQLFMTSESPSAELAEAHAQLWGWVIAFVTRFTGPQRAPDAAMALWALLHGMISLETICGLGKDKFATACKYGLNAWLTAASSEK